MAHILVIDDDATIRRLLVYAFSMEGHTVETLPDGRGALDALRASAERTVVFLDLMMPFVDGPTLCRSIEGEPELLTRHAVVIMSAALAAGEAAPACARATLTKPFNLERALALAEQLALEPSQLDAATSGHAEGTRR